MATLAIKSREKIKEPKRETEKLIGIQNQILKRLFDTDLYKQDKETQIEKLTGKYEINRTTYNITEDFLRKRLRTIDRAEFEQLNWNQRKEIRNFVEHCYKEREKSSGDLATENIAKSLGYNDRKLGICHLSENLIENILSKKEMAKPIEYQGNGKLNTNGQYDNNKKVQTDGERDSKVNNKKSNLPLEQKLTNLTTEQSMEVNKRLSEIYALEAPYNPSENYFIKRAKQESYNVADTTGQEYRVENSKIEKMAKEYYQARNPVSFFGKIKRFIFG